MKKILFFILTLIGFIGFAINAEDFYYDVTKDGEVVNEFDNESLEIGKLVNEDAVQNEEGILQKLLGLFKLKGSQWYNNDGDLKAFAYIKMIVNYMLALVSFIALILTIYGFYLMFFSGQDEGLKKAKKILTGVAIAIAIMGLSWFIISFIFWIININTQ